MVIRLPRQVLRVIDEHENPYRQYLEKNRMKAISRLGWEQGTRESQIFEDDLNLCVERISEFLPADRKSDVELVLGRVQSGKTAHMLGLIAWAAQSQISLVVLLSGNTKPLTSQTQSRIQSDIGNGNSQHFLIPSDQLPTVGSTRKFRKFSEEIIEAIEGRLRPEDDQSGMINSPMPVVTTLKSSARAASLLALLAEVAETFGDRVSVLLIDDEADQISQNGKASRGEETKFYESFSDVMGLDLKIFLAAYTATPQAIMLSERENPLRPFGVTVLNPGLSYFGLSDVVSEDYEKNRVTVEPLDQNFFRQFRIPEELQSALMQFLLVAQIRRRHPVEFFSAGSGPALTQFPDSKSCQMLIHPSGKQAEHQHFAQLVSGCLVRLARRAKSANPTIQTDSNFQSWNDEYQIVLSRIKETALRERLPSQLSIGILNDLADSIESSTRVKVVNSDPNREYADEPLPISDEEWKRFDAWILIGGDILARGITIPNLVVTYFLRNPKNHKFDMAVQQMRFCGYRKQIEDLTSIWAPEDIFELYGLMDEIDGVLIKRATQWSLKKRNLRLDPPKILYLGSVSARLDPTRKGVLDRSLHDRKFQKGNIIFQSKKPIDPGVVIDNSQKVLNFVSNYRDLEQPAFGWHSIQQVDLESAKSMLLDWNTSPGLDGSEIQRAAELFDANVANLGFADTPVNFFFRHLEVIANISTGGPIDLDQMTTTRGLSAFSGDGPPTLASWEQGFQNAENSPMRIRWYQDATIKPFVGDGQRRVRRFYSFDAACVVVEPIKVSATDSNAVVGVGMALAVMAPPNYSVRIMGFSTP